MCTESITRNPCCDTNSHIAADDTLSVMTVHTCTQHYFREARGCSVVEGRCFALVCPLLYNSTCAQGLRVGIPWGVHGEGKEFPEAELAGISTHLPSCWKAGWKMTKAFCILPASQCNILQRGTLTHGTWYRSCFSQRLWHL